ncbi:helix-turn-helix domain-containing protein [Streptomyces sp. VNUA24]|uniref:helix-turn-helix domain-containing protein n=1 Tax=Streptomyces sp. VNUA24 TaxID=3031131 RepID=UPI0023B8276B|nr:helix-turn-helix domain-containing protein [Streptomyces sp. VNUA24]WEH13688.1 helix-turn-helix domain-containing protein [Streptomyces sp. VNUA24]
MGASPHAEKFAACLRMLKDRSGRGYDRLGKEAGVSGSSLHRYCSGLSVPTDYRVVHAFAKVCGASAEELRELHRLWALADTERDAPPATAAASAGPGAPAEREPAPGTAVPEAAESAERPADDTIAPETVGGGPGRSPRSRITERLTSRFALLAAVVVVTLVAGLVWWPAGAPAGASPPSDDRLLYSPACASVSMGQHDACVREVQVLLTRAGGRLAVDGDFGPETLRRLTAFQVLARVAARSVVDDATKKALYAGKVSMASWSPAKVTERIRAVFVEDPDTAVAIARCSSFLDPLWVLPNTNGSRNWGVFQISDASLRKLDGTPLRAFDPAWNIEAAHRLWSVRRDFHDWPACEAALKDTPEKS